MKPNDVKQTLDTLWQKAEQLTYIQMNYPANHQQERQWLLARVKIYAKLVETYSKNLKEII